MRHEAEDEGGVPARRAFRTTTRRGASYDWTHGCGLIEAAVCLSHATGKEKHRRGKHRRAEAGWNDACIQPPSSKGTTAATLHQAVVAGHPFMSESPEEQGRGGRWPPLHASPFYSKGETTKIGPDR